MAQSDEAHNVRTTWGHHTIYHKNPASKSMLDQIRALYPAIADLGDAHLHSSQYQSTPDKSTLSEVDTDLHRPFYDEMKRDKSPLKSAYTTYIRALLREKFPDRTFMVAQRMPCIRFHLPGTVTVPPHRDIDEGPHRTAHPVGELNFLLTLTPMEGTNAIHIESEPGKGDVAAVSMDAGELMHFDGNQCLHQNYVNESNKTRVSIDFRAISLDDFDRYCSSNIKRVTRPNAARPPIALAIGEYYEIIRLSPSEIPQMKPAFGVEEADAARDYILSGGYLTEFKQTRAMEAEIASIVGTRHAVMVCNGTMAIAAALLGAGIVKNDVVVVPSFTMVATANAVHLIGARAIVVDVDAGSHTLMLDAVKPYLHVAKAVIHVSLNNRSAGLEALVEGCRSAGVILVEDAAQSLGCRYKGRALGSFGDVGTFSFSSPKIISTGQGGCVVTNDADIANAVRRVKDFGREMPGTEVYSTFGVNLKFTDLQAVVGLEQLKRLPDRIMRMRVLWDTYYRELHDVVRMVPAADNEWIPWFVEVFTEDRDRLAGKLRALGIGVREVYPPIKTTENTPVAARLRQTGLWLPSWSDLKPEVATEVAKCVRLLL